MRVLRLVMCGWSVEDLCCRCFLLIHYCANDGQGWIGCVELCVEVEVLCGLYRVVC